MSRIAQERLQKYYSVFSELANRSIFLPKWWGHPQHIIDKQMNYIVYFK